MELLKRIVRKDGCPEFVGNLQDEGISSADRSSRRGDDLACIVGGFKYRKVLGINPIGKRRVDDHQHVGTGVLLNEAAHGLVELRETRHSATLSSDVGTINHDFVRGHMIAF